MSTNDPIQLNLQQVGLSTEQLENQIYSKLLIYQVKHVKQLLNAMLNYAVALDCSDTGTGKTYSAIGLAALLLIQLIIDGVFIVCPKSVISTWRKVAKIFGVKVYGIINYETLKLGKYYNENGQKVKCPYIEVIEDGKNFIWKLPAKTLIIYDEVHKAKNIKSINAKLLNSAKVNLYYILMLSATVADREEFFANCAYMLGLCPNVRLFSLSVKQMKQKNPNQPIMNILHKQIFPKKGSRLRIADLGDLFPKNQIAPETYSMGKDIEKQIQEQYELLNVAVQEYKKKEALALHPLERIIRARQKIEALKVQTFVELAKEYLENDHSVVIFVNFTETLNLIASKLNTNCVIHGQQTLSERDSCVDNFQENKERLIVAQMQSGGVGISLHDLRGPDENHPKGYPRVSLISPTWSAQDLVQALGRIHRANGKTHCLQRIIFCANTVEEDICSKLQVKINNFSQLNDGLDDTKIQLENGIKTGDLSNVDEPAPALISEHLL
jgi:superfamily II DNA or RNA helicase